MPGTKTMDKWKAGTLHSGSKTGPIVKSHKQAVAIMLSENRKAKSHMPKGSTQSPRGDIGAQRVAELGSAIKNKIKNSGSGDPNPLKYRKPQVASDDGRNTSL